MRSIFRKSILQIFISVFVIQIFILSSAFAEKIVIIGAGLSGLTTAYEIQKEIQKLDHDDEHNVELDVYEAKDRPGGRVFSVYLNGKPVELGGENIKDGGEAKSIRRLISELGLKTTTHLENFGDRYFYDPKLKKSYHINRDLMSAFPDLSNAKLVKALERAGQDSKNIEEVLDKFFKKYEPDSEEEKAKAQLLKAFVRQRMETYEGGTVREQSTQYIHGSLSWMLQSMQDKYQAYRSEKNQPYSSESVEGGNSRLVLAIAKALGPRLHLKHPLRSIRKTKENQFELSFVGTQKKIVHADILVLAIPCTVYKKINFGAGTLPPERIAKISRVAYGTHAKILIPYNEDKEFPSVTAQNMVGWASQSKKQITFYFSRNFGIMQSPKDFTLRAAYGIEAFRSMGVHLKFDQKLYQIGVPTKIFSSYTRPVGKSWAMDPDIGGSYSHLSADMAAELETTISVDGEKVLPLFAPFFAPINGKIFFAGEHTTTDLEIRGTMEAAVESGELAARMILHELDI